MALIGYVRVSCAHLAPRFPILGTPFVVHQPTVLWPLVNGGESAALFCWAFLAIAVLGAGPWSLDAQLGRPRHDRATGSAPRMEAADAGPTVASV
ncbi:DoxX family protein [Planosporangium sp. 12N6]|uniref:DoxX family protein n=1 Tax=Planosporangium spinosum TaxID=3402278 RepID=UPI003CE6ABA8